MWLVERRLERVGVPGHVAPRERVALPRASTARGSSRSRARRAPEAAHAILHVPPQRSASVSRRAALESRSRSSGTSSLRKPRCTRRITPSRSIRNEVGIVSTPKRTGSLPFGSQATGTRPAAARGTPSRSAGSLSTLTRARRSPCPPGTPSAAVERRQRRARTACTTRPRSRGTRPCPRISASESSPWPSRRAPRRRARVAALEARPAAPPRGSSASSSQGTQTSRRVRVLRRHRRHSIRRVTIATSSCERRHGSARTCCARTGRLAASASAA